MTGHSLLIRIHEDASLSNHVVIIATVHSETECGVLCSHDPSCRSLNVCGSVNNLRLNSATYQDVKDDLHWKILCSYYCAAI